MATFSKTTLSASSGGRMIQLNGFTPVTIHTTGTSATIFDEVWLYVTNNSNSSTGVYIEYGVSGTSERIEVLAPSPLGGLVLAVPGLLLAGTGSAGRTITAWFNGIGTDVYITGYVNRITP